MFFAFVENGEVVKVGMPEILFPNTSGANAAYALEQGAKEVVEGEQKDQRFYWVTFSHYEVTGDIVTRVYTNTPKQLEDVTNDDGSVTKGLKSQYIGQAKSIANSLLAATDWMVIRKAERGVEIPADVASERAKIIADCAAKEAAITAATTVEELMAIVAPVITAQV